MDVVRRRVIQCQGPKVLDVSDDLLTTEVAASRWRWSATARCWPRWPGPRATRMRDIVATIQREQDEAVRAPAAGVTLIEGGPGTGKTAVALHRAAHLLYRDRSRFEGGGVLLVGPSPVFMSYVERVLPSLGEDTAELRSLGEVVDGVQTDRLDPPPLAALKGSLRMRRFLQRALREAPPGAPTGLRIVYGGEVLRLRCRRPGPAAAAACTSGCISRTRPVPRSDGASWRPCGRCGPRGCRGPPRRSPTSSTTATSSSASSAPGGRCWRRPRCSAGSGTWTASGTRARTGSPRPTRRRWPRSWAARRAVGGRRRPA